MPKNIAEIQEVIESYVHKISDKILDEEVLLAGIGLKNKLNLIAGDESNLDVSNFNFSNKNQSLIRVDVIKLADISRLLPNPSDTDSKLYDFVFKTFAELQRRHLLGLRYGLRGSTSLFGMSVSLPYSDRDFIIPAMQKSFGSFLKDWKNYVPAIDVNIPEADLQIILENIQANISCADPKIEDIAALLEQEKNISLLYQTYSPSHWTSVVASKDIIIFADRWSKSIQTDKGIDICQYSSQKDVVAHLKQLHEESFHKHISTREKDARIKKDYKQISHIPLSLQKADNCGWSSGAKTIIYSNAILAFYQYFSERLDHDSALLKAQDCAKQLYHYWAHDYDRIQALREALGQPDDQIDLTLIAKILLQSENKTAPYRKKITKMIQERSIINDEIKGHAKNALLKDIKTTLEDDRTQTSEQAQQYLSYYLSKGGTKKADAFIKEEDSKLTEFINLCSKLNIMHLAKAKVLTPNHFEALSKAWDDELLDDVCMKALENKLIQMDLKYDNTFGLEQLFYTSRQQLQDLIDVQNVIGQDDGLEMKFALASIGSVQILDLRITPLALDDINAKLKEDEDVLSDYRSVKTFMDAYHEKLDPQPATSTSALLSRKKKH